MCGHDSMYSATNLSTHPSNYNQINAMSNSLVAGSGFLTDRWEYFIDINLYLCYKYIIIYVH